jgi:hypothetical protein
MICRWFKYLINEEFGEITAMPTTSLFGHMKKTILRFGANLHLLVIALPGSGLNFFFLAYLICLQGQASINLVGAHNKIHVSLSDLD